MNAFKYEIGLCYIPVKDKEYINLPNIKDGIITDVIVTINDAILSYDQYVLDDNKLIFVSKIQQDNVIKLKCTVSFNSRKVVIGNNPNNTTVVKGASPKNGDQGTPSTDTADVAFAKSLASKQNESIKASVENVYFGN